MIESLFNPSAIERKPWETFIAGFIITIVACALAMNIPTGGGKGFLIIYTVFLSKTLSN